MKENKLINVLRNSKRAILLLFYKINFLILYSLQKLSLFIKIKGLNIGSGEAWTHWFWQGIDQMDGSYLDKNSVLPYGSNTIDTVYSSHFFEHVDDVTASNIFGEVYRVLKPGGIFRILLPDFEQIKNCLVNNDKLLFEKIGFVGRPEWQDFNIDHTLENYVLHWFANYQNCPYNDSKHFQKHKEFFRGPPLVEKSLVQKKAATLSTLDFGKWAVKQVPKIHFSNGGHINTWNHEKLAVMLKKNGFFSKTSSFKQSTSRTMNLFDSITDRRLITIYHEAYKKSEI